MSTQITDMKLIYGVISVISWEDISEGESPRATFGLYTEDTPESEVKKDLLRRWQEEFDPGEEYQPADSGDYKVDIELTPITLHRAGETIETKLDKKEKVKA